MSNEELKQKQSAGGKKGNPKTKGFAHPERRHLASELGRKGGLKGGRGRKVEA